jgi:hypothetical protein
MPQPLDASGVVDNARGEALVKKCTWPGPPDQRPLALEQPASPAISIFHLDRGSTT